ncbi:MAG TPA: hypothetical protein VFI71_08815, partial [Pyrinomonadaceae bacterium]|nr:hypothetical protein [Pyrinomonadaceae bacterium]
MEVLFVLFIVLTIITLVGHGIWVLIRTLVRFVFLDDNNARSDQHVTRLFDTTNQPATDLFVTERQIVRFYREGKLNDETYERLMNCIRAERANLSPQPVNAPAKAPAPAPVTIPKPIETPPPLETPPPSVTASFADSDAEAIPEPAPSFINNNGHESEPRREQFTPPPRARRSFSEVLNAFMEESNIRWGEIIGGLLIIGCSTALVVSLWAQISQIPVLKFLIFTTVTAILFGIGLYTEHRWKLPTTSRGILTIATLLVPLNFLA